MFFFLTYFTLYNRLQFHPPHSNRFKCILFNSWIIFHCVYVLQVSYPFLCQWTSRLLSRPSSYKQCCSEHWGTQEHSFCLIHPSNPSPFSCFFLWSDYQFSENNDSLELYFHSEFPRYCHSTGGKMCAPKCVVVFLALFFITPVTVLPLKGLALIPSCIQSSPVQTWDKCM